MLLRPERAFTVAVAAALVALGAPAGASAAPSLYWADYGSAEVMIASLSGEGTPQALIKEPEGSQPEGVALDPATGKIYWTDEATGQIRAANLDGGEPVTLFEEPGSEPMGITIDPATGTLYWADNGNGAIRDGSVEGGSAATLLSEPEGSYPAAVIVDPENGKLYWSDPASEEIRAGNLGSVDATAETLYAKSAGSAPTGLAIDAATQTIYWTDEGTEEIRSGGLGGEAATETAQTLYKEGEVGVTPWGLAVDPQSSELYWSAYEAGEISFGKLGGEPDKERSKQLYRDEDEPGFLALLTSPEGSSPPVVSGGTTVDQPLTCSTGAWQPDLPEASFYRAPESFSYQWLREGTPVSGANAASFTPTQAGSYTCEVTASNAAGSTTQTSAATTVKAPVVCAIPAATSSICPCGAPCPPPLPKASKLTIESGRKLVVKAGKVKAVLACSQGSGNCEGKLSLVTEFSHSMPPRHGKSHKRKQALPKLTFAHPVPYTLAAGARKTIVLKIDAKGMKLLQKAKGHRLKLWLLAMYEDGKTANGVTLVLPSSHEHHKHKH